MSALFYVNIGYATINVNEIGGMYKSFKDDYKYLSPIFGLAALWSYVPNIRFHGAYGAQNKNFLCHKQITHPAPGRRETSDIDCPQDNTTAFVQHLFPSPGGGELRISNIKSDLFTWMTIEQIGQLLNSFTEYKISRQREIILKSLSNIVLPDRKSTREDIAKNWGLGKSGFNTLLEIYTDMLIGTLQEKDRYPSTFIESALLAFAVKKAESAKKLLPLLDSLSPYQDKPLELTPFSKEIYNAFKKSNLRDKKISTESFVELFKDPELLTFLTLGYDTFDDPFPPNIETGSAKFGEISFTDCGESSLRSLFNLLLSDSDQKTFHPEYLTKLFPNARKDLVRFYENFQSTYDMVQAPNIRSDWANVVSNLKPFVEGEPLIQYGTSGTCNIKGIGIDNILLVIERLINDDDFKTIRINAPSDDQRRALQLDYLLGKFSRDGFQLTWKKIEKENSLFNMRILINDVEYFEWDFLQGHFSFSKINSEVEFDWTRNNSELLIKLLESPALPMVLKTALLPFYFNDDAGVELMKRPKDISPLAPAFLYGLNWFNLNQRLMPLELIASLNTSIANQLIKNWLPLSLPAGEFAHYNPSCTAYNLSLSPASNVDYLKEKNAQTFLSMKNEPIYFLPSNYFPPSCTPLLIEFLDRQDPNEVRASKDFHLGETILLFSMGTWENLDLVRFLLDRFPELIEEKDNKGHTALHAAAKYNRPLTTGLLLEKYPMLAKNNDLVFSSDQKTPLDVAIENNHIEIVEILLDKAPQLVMDKQFAKNKSGETVLHRIIDVNAASIESENVLRKKLDILKLLMIKAPHLALNNELAKDNTGKTAVHKIFFGAKKPIKPSNSPNASYYLLESLKILFSTVSVLFNDVLHAKDHDGNTPLHSAFQKTSFNPKEEAHLQARLTRISLLTQALIKLAPHLTKYPFIQNNAGSTPLHLAVELNDIGLMKFLLQALPNLAKDENLLKKNDGVTPLFLADKYKYMDLVKIIAEAMPKQLLAKELEDIETISQFKKLNLGGISPDAKAIVEDELKKEGRLAD